MSEIMNRNVLYINKIIKITNITKEKAYMVH